MLAIDVLKDIETASKVWRAPADPFELLTDPYDVGLGVARQVEGDDRLAGDGAMSVVSARIPASPSASANRPWPPLTSSSPLTPALRQKLASSIGSRPMSKLVCVRGGRGRRRRIRRRNQ